MANNRQNKVSTLIEAFPEYPHFDSHGAITKRVAELYRDRNLVKRNAKTPSRTAAEEMQELNRDTETYHSFLRKGGDPDMRPNLFQKVEGKGWALRDTKDNTFRAAGVERFCPEAVVRPGVAETEPTQVTPPWEIPSEFREKSATQQNRKALKEEADKTGRKGEALVDRHFEQQVTAGKIRKYKWVSKIDSEAPVDFLRILNSGDKQWVEVKSTKGPFQTRFFISLGELQEAAKDRSYLIYRVYEVAENDAKLRVLMIFNAVAREILAAMEKLPTRVSVDDVMVDPRVRGAKKGPEIILQSG